MYTATKPRGKQQKRYAAEATTANFPKIWMSWQKKRKATFSRESIWNIIYLYWFHIVINASIRWAFCQYSLFTQDLTWYEVNIRREAEKEVSSETYRSKAAASITRQTASLHQLTAFVLSAESCHGSEMKGSQNNMLCVIFVY